MLHFTWGDLLAADVQALVNPVNTVGVAGRGLALEFKHKHPWNFHAYQAACLREEVVVGHMFVVSNPEPELPGYVINFPTKEDWRNPSRIGWIRDGLADLVRVIREREIISLAVPALGCGNGRLAWSVVRAEIEHALAPLEDVLVMLYQPLDSLPVLGRKPASPKERPEA